MFAYVTKKLLMVVPTVLGVTLVVFLMIRLIPGDPVVNKVTLVIYGQEMMWGLSLTQSCA